MKSITLILFIIICFTVPAFAQVEDAHDLFYRVRRLELNKNYDDAIKVISRAIKLQPDNPDFYLERAFLNSMLKNDQGVIEDVQAAIALKPDDYQLAERGAMRLIAIGQYEESLRLAENLLSKNAEGRYYGYKIRYQTRLQLKNYQGAFDDVIEGHLVLRAISEGLMSKILYGLKDDPKIDEHFDKLFKFLEERKDGPMTTGTAMALQRDRLILYADYAQYYRENHNAAEVDRLFDKYEKELGLYGRAGVYERLGNYDAATADLIKSLKSAAKVGEYLKNCGDSYFIFGKLEKSIELYEAAKKIYHDERFQKLLDANIKTSKDFLIEQANQPK